MTISITKPTVGGSENTWGTTVNAALDTIVDGINGTSGTIAPDLSTLTINGTDVTATAAELNILDGVTATTTELNKLDGVTATTAELNIMDGVTATTAELNKLDGVTATTAELNILDGVTATAAELNILDGVTSTAAELNILDGVTSTAAELNLLDGSTANTVVNNKAVVYGSSGEVQATTVDLGNWTVTESSGVLYFATGGTNKMKLDASGNLTVVGDVTAYGTI